MRPADAANVIHDLPPERRGRWWPPRRRAPRRRPRGAARGGPGRDPRAPRLRARRRRPRGDVPDDAADLIADLSPETAATLLELMEPEEAEDVKRLMSYAEETAGGMMTPEPVILAPDATDRRRAGARPQPRAHPVARGAGLRLPPPLETPTGGSSASPTSSGCCASRRRRWSPARSTTRSTRCARDRPIEDVAAHLATYNLVAAPVVDEDGHLLGAVTVDDLLDHMLPDRLARPARCGHERPMSSAAQAPRQPRDQRRAAVAPRLRHRGVRCLRRAVRPLHGHGGS
jgi:hypothetical protein